MMKDKGLEEAYMVQRVTTRSMEKDSSEGEGAEAEDRNVPSSDAVRYKLYPEEPDEDFVKAQDEDVAFSRLKRYLLNLADVSSKEELEKDKELNVMFSGD